ncbi:MAG: RNA-binding protein [Candidatus Heimdallarchaeota archaeon]|nr:RNA-binding protein [Candidatus Heimdallarchaeota archaeon]
MTINIENKEIVVPGQLIAKGDYKAGNGVIKRDDEFYPSIVGVFGFYDQKNELRVRPLQGRYFPKIGDFVIGYIEDVKLTSWDVHIKGPYTGILLASNAVRGRFDPIKDDARRIFDIGDVIRAEILSFDRTRDPQLTTSDRGLGKLSGGRIVDINPNHIPRLVGRKGSMISMIKKYTDCRILVGQNGRVWVKSDKIENEELALHAIQQVSREAHVSGLTDRIKALLEEHTTNR